jgi:hypothetical protein
MATSKPLPGRLKPPHNGTTQQTEVIDASLLEPFREHLLIRPFTLLDLVIFIFIGPQWVDLYQFHTPFIIET